MLWNTIAHPSKEESSGGVTHADDGDQEGAAPHLIAQQDSFGGQEQVRHLVPKTGTEVGQES